MGGSDWALPPNAITHSSPRSSLLAGGQWRLAVGLLQAGVPFVELHTTTL
eukprot:NODE_10693_length_201_cov_33.019737_g9533_i0.p2 GENE.NODE_10693_length_201_cov_33.019737_g9533_i0~~NODE_10693_length_201_cov_33.019737_g9533_i0.p2  ORF type:complete len:59 (-),score=39.50 NODE_10693_length_201_cov_33.019737_g9533_i0:24-173(-)